MKARAHRTYVTQLTSPWKTFWNPYIVYFKGFLFCFYYKYVCYLLKLEIRLLQSKKKVIGKAKLQREGEAGLPSTGSLARDLKARCTCGPSVIWEELSWIGRLGFLKSFHAVLQLPPSFSILLYFLVYRNSFLFLAMLCCKKLSLMCN